MIKVNKGFTRIAGKYHPWLTLSHRKLQQENSFIALVQAPLHEERWKTNLYKAMSPVNPFALPLF